MSPCPFSVTGLQVLALDPRILRPRASNPRKHSKAQIGQIGESIRRFGFVNPVLIDADNGIIAGHGRVEAAKQLGLPSVPVLRVDHLSPTELRALVIADNKIAANAGWDRELLALEVRELSQSAEIAIEVLGFETPEIDNLLLTSNEADPLDQLPVNLSAAPVTRLGDVWCLGDHRLGCGDARDPDALRRLLGDERAAMVFTDPPFNLKVADISGLGRTQHREFAMASGEMLPEAYTAFLNTVLRQLCAFSIDGSIHFVCMDHRHLREVLAASQEPYGEPLTLCVWTKSNGGMGGLYRNAFELIFAFKNGQASHINNVRLGKYGRNRTNVWRYAGQNSFGPDRAESLEAHPTVKPTALVADAILDCTKRGALVLDSFAGSGTTILAAEKTGRLGRTLEIDPIYCDVIIRRMQDAFGIRAIHLESGLDYDALGERRAAEKTVDGSHYD